MVGKEREDVCALIDLHRLRFAGTVPCFRLNAYQNGCITGLRRLQCRDELETVRRNNAVVMVAVVTRVGGYFTPGLML